MPKTVSRSEVEYECKHCGKRFLSYYDCSRHESDCGEYLYNRARARSNCPRCGGTGKVLDMTNCIYVPCPNCG